MTAPTSSRVIVAAFIDCGAALPRRAKAIAASASAVPDEATAMSWCRSATSCIIGASAAAT